MGHTRGSKRTQCPSPCHPQVAVVHNGIISFAERTLLEQKGHVFTSNGIPLVAHLVTDYLDKGLTPNKLPPKP